MNIDQQIISVAIVGSGQYLAFTPCHNRPVRLSAEEVQRFNTVRCSKDSRLWKVRFFKEDADWFAVWTP